MRNVLLFPKFQMQIMLGIFWLFSASSWGQGYLDLEVTVRWEQHGSMAEVLDQLERQHGFFFSYPSAALPPEFIQDSEPFSGKMYRLLESVFGSEYEFKEMPGYVIVRFAPKRLQVDTEIDQRGGQAIVTGTITRQDNGEPVQYASVYERNQLTSTLSDEIGSFELKLRRPGQTIWITLSKEGFRDTSFVVLPTVDISAHAKGGRLRFRPESDASTDLEQSLFGRLFIGMRQRLQRINLGGFFGESPYQMSLVPGIGSQGVFGSQMVNKFSLNLIGGYSAGTEGFETAGIFNINRLDMKGAQIAGIANLVGGSVSGFQVAGIHNRVYGQQTGLQVSGIHNRSYNHARGIQIAGVINHSDSLVQHQLAGIANRGGQATGTQVAGIVNTTEAHGSVQVSGISNRAKGTAKAQVSGIVNRATTVSNLQLGLINIADSSAYPIGLVNWVKTGSKSLAVGVDEMGAAQLTLRTGGTKLYGLLGYAHLIGNPYTPHAYDIGFGVYLLEAGNVGLDMEWVHRTATDFKTVTNHYSSMRAIPRLRLNSRTTVFLAPSLSLAVLDDGAFDRLRGWTFQEYHGNTNSYFLYAGLSGGLMIYF
ncbi:MAG: hypothetical protein JJU34_08380 [Lunatimonas sp.]|uniref:carboxypeptidase-like regulatory domain-containing protein n=1 Tax=Lunatimonas sp. TaxID=2060141 RepID=UPI00263AF0B0|nr:carboxypeptidase-like regulatory domain-containing protein [Lunatimonas sp.]MCC5937283.1 hypothetical protein [Lunatimonas sp.]